MRITHALVRTLALGVALLTAGCGYIAAPLVVLAVDDDGGGGGSITEVAAEATVAAEIEQVSRLAGDVQEVRVRLQDEQAGQVRLRLAYREAGAASFSVASVFETVDPSGPVTLPSAPDGTTALLDAPAQGANYVLRWRWTDDLGPQPQTGVDLELRVVGADGSERSANLIVDQIIGNEPPEIDAVTVTGERGTVVVRFGLRDSTADLCDVVPVFRIPGEAPQPIDAPAVNPETVTNLAATTGFTDFSFRWDTLLEPRLATARVVDLIVELVPREAADPFLEGTVVSSPPVTIANNEPVQVVDVLGARTSNTAGEATITFRLQDPDGGDPTIDIEARVDPLDGSEPFLAALTAGSATTSLATDGSAQTVTWRYRQDLGSDAPTTVAFQITPIQDGASPGISTPFTVGNEPPDTVITTAGGGTRGGVIPIAFTLLDATADRASIQAEFALAGGAFSPAVLVVEPSTSLRTEDPDQPGQPFAHLVAWDSVANLPDQAHTDVTFRIRADDGLFLGAEAQDGQNAIVFSIDNTVEDPGGGDPGGDPGGAASTTVDLVGPSAGTPRGGTMVVVAGDGFVDGSTQAVLGGAPLRDIEVLSANALVGRTPPGRIGTVDLVVTSPNGTATLTSAFQYARAITMARSRSTRVEETDPTGVIEVVLETDDQPLATAAVCLLDNFVPTTALAPADYVQISNQQVAFPAGSIDGDRIALPFRAFDDTVDEGPETVSFRLRNANANTLLGPLTLHTVTILDDDTERVIDFGIDPAAPAGAPFGPSRAQIGQQALLDWDVVTTPRSTVTLVASPIEPGALGAGPLDVTQAATSLQVTPYAGLAEALADRAAYRIATTNPTAKQGAQVGLLVDEPAPGSSVAISFRGVGARADGGFYVTGSYGGSAQLGQGGGSPVTLPDTASSRNVLIARYAPDGALVWATRAESTTGTNVGISAAVLPDGAVAVYGELSSSNATFFDADGDVAGIASGHLFVAVYEPDGELRWLRSFATVTSPATSDTLFGQIAALPDGGVGVASRFLGTLTLGAGEPNETTLSADGTLDDALIARFFADGTLAWAKRVGGSNHERARAIAPHPQGGVVVGGRYASSVATFAPGEPEQTTRSGTSTNGFVMRLAADGRLVWVRAISGASSQFVYGIAVFPSGEVGVAGTLGRTSNGPVPVTFEGGAGNETLLTSDGIVDFEFVARYDRDGNHTAPPRRIEFASSFEHTVRAVGLPDGTMAVSYEIPTSANGFAIFGRGEARETALLGGGSTDLGVALFDRDNTLLWARREGGSSVDSVGELDALPNGAILMASQRGNAIIFGPSEPNETTTSGDGSQVVRYDPANYRVRTVAPDGHAWVTAVPAGFGAGLGDAAALPDRHVVWTGAYSGTATFGRTGGLEETLTSAGGTDGFVARQDPAGELVWARGIGGIAADLGQGVAAHLDGSVTVCGTFSGTATFATSTAQRTAAGSADAYVARLDAAGDLVYARTVGGVGSDLGNGVAALADGGAVLCGRLEGVNVQVDGTSPILLDAFGGAGDFDAFLARYDAAGEPLWALRAGGDDSDEAFAVAALPGTAIFVVGKYRTSGASDATFGTTSGTPGTLGSIGLDDVFVARYDLDGVLQWVRRAGGAALDAARGVDVLPDGSAIVIGNFGSDATFGTQDPGDQEVQLAGSGVFVARYGAAGELLFARAATATGPIFADGVASLPDGSVLVSGRFSGTATFAPGVSAAAAETDAFLARYGADGQLLDVRFPVSGAGSEGAFAVAPAGDGSVFVTGFVAGPAGGGDAVFGAGESNEERVTLGAGEFRPYVMRVFGVGD